MLSNMQSENQKRIEIVCALDSNNGQTQDLSTDALTE